MSRRRKIVTGMYRCGCSYGPVLKKDRLEYCEQHGDDVQREYDVTRLVNEEDLPKDDGEEQVKYAETERNEVTKKDGRAHRQKF